MEKKKKEKEEERRKQLPFYESQQQQKKKLVCRCTKVGEKKTVFRSLPDTINTAVAETSAL